MKKSLICLFLLQLTLPLGAAEDANKLSKRYLKLKDSSDAYVGEGVAKLTEFAGDGLKALEAARERARANLAASVRVRIVSETREQSSSGPEGSTETVESKSASLADVILENVRVEDFIGLPDKDQITALAIVSKQDYRRQLAGKGPRVYRPEYGLRLIYVATTTFDFQKVVGDENQKWLSVPLKPGTTLMQADGNAESLQGLGLEFRFRDWSLSAEMGLVSNVLIVPYDPVDGLYGMNKGGLETLTASIGYDWTPWAWRVQPYLPLALRYTHVSLTQYEAWAPAASAGLGLRYWPNDSLAFDISGRYIHGLANAALMRGGKPLYLGPGKPAELSLNGAQWQVSLLWSGF